MPEFHAEPYIYLPAISHKSVLVAWGAFYFRAKSSGETKLVDPDDLRHIHPPRKDTIGARSAPYGPARVEVLDAVAASKSPSLGRTRPTIAGSPDCIPTPRTLYRVIVNDEEWASGVRWDWSPSAKALVRTMARTLTELGRGVGVHHRVQNRPEVGRRRESGGGRRPRREQAHRGPERREGRDADERAVMAVRLGVAMRRDHGVAPCE